MAGLGTIINLVGILLGGLLGLLFGKFIKERHQETLMRACGICILFIGAAGALSGMLTVKDNLLESGKSLFIIACIAPGAVIGEIINIEGLFERFGTWLKIKTGNAKDGSFVEAFFTATMTICIGAMAVIGAINDGIYGDYSVLITKAIIDFVLIMVLTCSLGKGSIFAAIPVVIFQGTVTALARLIKPVMTQAALSNLSLVGSILIFCVGLNVVWGKKLKVANMLPSILIAITLSFLPVQF